MHKSSEHQHLCKNLLKKNVSFAFFALIFPEGIDSLEILWADFYFLKIFILSKISQETYNL